MSPQATAVVSVITTTNDLGHTITTGITIGVSLIGSTSSTGGDIGGGSDSATTKSVQRSSTSTSNLNSPRTSTSKPSPSETNTVSSTQTTPSSSVGMPTSLVKSPSRSNGGLNTGTAIGIGVAISVFTIVVLCGIGFICYRKRVRKNAIQSRHARVYQEGRRDVNEADGNRAGADDKEVFYNGPHELSTKLRPGELETRANRHELAGNLDCSRHELKSDL